MPENTRQSELLHRLDKVPRAAWKRFATHFKHLVHRPEVSATKSPVQNIRAVCDSISTARPTAQPTKRRTKKTPGTRRRRRWIIPKWVIDGALLALFVAGVAKLERLLSEYSTRKRFYIQAKINDDTLFKKVNEIQISERGFSMKEYSLHITLVKGYCERPDYWKIIHGHCLKDVKDAVINTSPTFTLTGKVYIPSKCKHMMCAKVHIEDTALLRTLRETLNDICRKWVDDGLVTTCHMDNNLHVTLGTFFCTPATKEHIRTTLETKALVQSIKNYRFADDTLSICAAVTNKYVNAHPETSTRAPGRQMGRHTSPFR